MNVRGDFLGPPHGTTTRALICKVKVKPHQLPCNDPETKARENILQFCEFHIGSRFKDYKSKLGPNN